jgi:hypothetical protein
MDVSLSIRRKVFIANFRTSEKKKFGKKEGLKRAAHNCAHLINMRATPTSLLLIKRSGTPTSLSI